MLRLLAFTVAMLLFATPSYGVLIDSFQTPQSLSVTSNNLYQVSGPGIVGGYRDLGILSYGGTISIDIQDGVLLYEADPGTAGFAGITWDGFPPNGLPSVPSFAVGPVDLTDGGTLNALAVTVLSSNLPFILEFHMFSTDAPHDYYSLNVPGGIAAPQTFTIPFASFSTTSSHGEKANYHRILALGTWIIQDVPGVNFQLGTIETVFVPEPSSIALASLGLVGLSYWRRRTQSGSNRR